jgi:hypothetical protein
VHDRTFVVVISDRALPHSIENIGKGLLELNGNGLHSGARSIESVLHDVLQGIRDKVLLKTHLTHPELENLLHRQLGRDFKSCTIEWIESAQ